jgi:ribonuclease HI
MQLAKHNGVIWVPGHERIDGNERADQLAKLGSERPFTGPEPTCDISLGVAKKVVRDWTFSDHRKHWD